MAVKPWKVRSSVGIDAMLPYGVPRTATAAVTPRLVGRKGKSEARVRHADALSLPMVNAELAEEAP